jgi:hypothetical protein
MKGILTIIGGQKTPLLGPGKPSDQSISQPLPTIGNEKWNNVFHQALSTIGN